MIRALAYTFGCGILFGICAFIWMACWIAADIARMLKPSI